MPEATERRRETVVRLPFEVDPGLTLGVLWQGPGDRRMRFAEGSVVRAARTPSGPATMLIRPRGGREIGVAAWGRGADEAMAAVPMLLGAGDDPDALKPHHPLITELARTHPGLRMTRTGGVFDALLPAIVGQKVTGFESSHSYWALLRRYGEPAPGPFGLTLPPAPEVLAAEPYWRFHQLGVERRRADVIRHAAAVAPQLEAAARTTNASVELQRRLISLPGVGPWTAAETARIALGDPDAVSVGDYHIPNLVSWALAGEARATDDRMLELLAPYAGQRARVVLLLELSGIRVPRFGPRMAARSIAAI
jgi:3-methyladenine DNA glycosylase/8-oxoguanine DNA glycosylase